MRDNCYAVCLEIRIEIVENVLLLRDVSSKTKFKIQLFFMH